MLREDGTIKVLDFGIARRVHLDVDEAASTQRGAALAKIGSMRGADTVTSEGVMVGTPAYMAPEVALGHAQIDGRVDIYGLGCVAYYLLTGSQVFAEATPTAAALAHVQKIPTPPSQITELPIPPELEEIVLRCLEKKPQDRPASARELRRLLDAVPLAEPWTPEDATAWWELNRPTSEHHESR